MDDRNSTTYAAADIVNYYAQLNRLQPAEADILERLRHQLPTMKMLDMGVGGGRTAQHFAPLVQQYVGIDYSAEMVTACQKRFSTCSYATRFETADARDLSQFEDNSFDFILFSFNGIDYVSHGDRLRILQEIKRVGKQGCYFFFSSHNLQALEREMTWQKQIAPNPLKTYENLVMLGLFWLFNRPMTRQLLATSQHLIVRDESHNFRLDTYYIRAAQQVEQLSQDFSQVEIYPWQSTESIADMDAAIMGRDLWLYYLCRIETAN
ncbi:class I SAM-dependent methyltransferase [Leptothoe kymatousa]|uniref:Methyltransferase domain-containing protein n=1 Tax=Leptothoe kymatousa TAU-MAC 1615 TaxID=2364775 RepID=A0ABS5Y1S3_9CYAN|nr:class I SAM-dependent methyltransferase [Leptothoe kymatousa]MBT9311745.1 methyltransferase domain-containing protein [Leptothoe kymatousa TAU-MAC 1615]